MWQQVAEWVFRLFLINRNHFRKLGAERFFAGLSGKKLLLVDVISGLEGAYAMAETMFRLFESPTLTFGGLLCDYTLTFD